MAEESKAPAKAESKSPEQKTDAKRSAGDEQRREAAPTWEHKEIPNESADSAKQQDGRGVDLYEGKIATGSGAERISFQQTRLKRTADGRTVLSDHLKAGEELLDIQDTITENQTARGTAWRA